MSGMRLYDDARGIWRVGKQRASRASLAFAVADEKVVEIRQWHPANTTPYASGRQDQSHTQHENDFEFTGTVAPLEIRIKYLGWSVKHLFGRGQNPIRYLNC